MTTLREQIERWVDATLDAIENDADKEVLDTAPMKCVVAGLALPRTDADRTDC